MRQRTCKHCHQLQPHRKLHNICVVCEAKLTEHLEDLKAAIKKA